MRKAMKSGISHVLFSMRRARIYVECAYEKTGKIVETKGLSTQIRMVSAKDVRTTKSFAKHRA